MTATAAHEPDVDAERGHPLARLYTYASAYRGRIWGATVASVLNKLFDLAPPVLIGAAVDVVVAREASFIARLGVTDVADQLVVLAIVTVLIWGLESVFEYVLATTWRNLAQTIQHDLRLDVYAHIQRLDMAYFHEQSTGGLMSVLNDDINQLERFLDSGANDIIQVTTTAIVISIAFFIMAPSVAWMAMLPVPVVLWGSFKFQDLLAPRYADVRQKVSELNGLLGNNLSGIATIKSYTTEDYEIARVRHRSEAYRQSNRSAIRLSSAFSPLIRMAIVVGFTATLVAGGKLVLAGGLAVGTYSVLVFLTQRLLWPLTRLGQTFDQYQRAMASTHRALELLHTPITIHGGDATLPTTATQGRVVFEDVTFAYPERAPLLQRFNLTIEPGQTIGIVGATGSGKTTLINLLLRFYAPQSGTITLDDQAIDTLTLDAVRGAVGLVSQSTYLFSGTIFENIAYGNPDASPEAVRQAATIAEALEFIDALPDGLQARVGERGETLSGGQRQRLSIARAVLKDPPILILDEATSAVDNETEAALQRSLERISADRTTLVIAHRLSTVRHADQIIVLDHGQIAERGDHDSLLAQGGIYARLWGIQTGEAPTPGA